MYLAKRSFEKILCKSPLAYAHLRTLFGPKAWEKQTFLKTITPGWTVVEIGANLGYFTNLFQALVGINAQLYAF